MMASEAETPRMLAGIVLTGHDGIHVRLGDLWAHEPAVVVWLRHYS